MDCSQHAQLSTARMKVLYLEDNALDADLVRIELVKRAPEIQLDIVSTLTEALARLEQFYTVYGNSQKRTAATTPIWSADAGFNCYELVLTDLNLPDGSGKTLLAQVRSWRLPLPVVFLTGSGSEELLLALLRAGADDYVIKRGGYLETQPLVLLAALEKFHTETFWRAAALKVVFVDPNPRDIDLTRRELVALAPHLNVESLQTAEEVFQRFAASGSRPDIDVLLLDYRLPGASATDILKELCQVRGLDVPIVLVIGQGDEEIARQSLKLGAADYVVKSPGYIQRLPTVIENVWLRAESTRRERVLLEERARLSLATEAAAIGIWEWNIANNEIIWDDRMYDIHGVPRGTAITHVIWSSHIHPDDLTEKEAQLNQIREENGTRQFDFRILQRHEQVRHVHIAKTVKFGKKNELTIVGTAIDITEQKQTELAIQQHAMQQGLIAAFGQKALASAYLDELWHEAAVIAAKGIDVTFSKALLLAPDMRSFNLKAGLGWQEGWVGRCISYTNENSQNRFVLASHQAVVVDDFCTETRFKPSKILKSHQIRSAAGVV
ncbi:MAG TPA: response regulator, partial [Nitrosospira sp.]|nr:response regulator [Nitrosospira sp.]